MNVSLKNVNSSLHKFLFCSVSAVCLTSIAFAQPAHAAGTAYLLQLGSFDTKEQAVQKWQDLKSQDPDILGQLNPHITEISSSSDDSKMMYRTEAGPVDSHAAASKLCGQLQAKGADCAVVETAMYDDTASDQAAAETKPAAEPATAAATPAAAPAEPSAAMPSVSAEPTNSVAESAPAPVSTPASPPQMAEKSASSIVYIPGREPKFLDEDNPVSPAIQSVAVPAAAPAEEKTAETDTSGTHDRVIADRAPKFLDTDETKPAQAAAVAETQPQPEPAAPAARPAPTQVAATDEDDDEESPAESRRPSLFGHKARKTGQAIPTTRSAQAETATTIQPAKPANSGGFFSRLFGNSSAPKEEPQIAAEPLPAPTPAPAVTTPEGSKSVEGNVSVAEAVRVPLTNGTDKPAMRVQTQTVKPTLTLGGYYWAQVNYFSDEATAHNFYEQFRSAHPEISDGVRMSISRPYAYANTTGHVTLRIGSFASLDDIGIICSAAAQYGLHCVSIYEGQNASSSNAASDNLPHARILNHASDTSADKAASADNGPFRDADPSTFWAQLGSFDSPDDAWDKWREIQRRHRKVVGKTSADVSQPEASSAAHKVFRLRAGPFASQTAADYLCGKLTKSGEDCLVVGEK